MLFGFRGNKKTNKIKEKKNYEYEFNKGSNLDFADTYDDKSNEESSKTYNNNNFEVSKKNILFIEKEEPDKTSKKILNKTSNMLSFFDEDEDKKIKEYRDDLNVNQKLNSLLNRKRTPNLKSDSNVDKKQSLNDDIRQKYKKVYSSDYIHDLDDFIIGEKIEEVNIIDEDKFDNTVKLEEENKDYDQPSTEYLIPEEEDNLDARYKTKIDQIRQLREKKRLIEFKEEKYDQDYVEVKETNSKDLIKDVYSFINQHDVFDIKKMDDHSDSEKELLQWEMIKLKNGMNANWALNQHRIKPKTVGIDISEVFKNIKVQVDIEEIISKVKSDIEKEQLHQESLSVILENYTGEIEENHHKKTISIQKVDDYINQYQNLKKIYAIILKDIKKTENFNKDKILQKFSEELFYFSD